MDEWCPPSASWFLLMLEVDFCHRSFLCGHQARSVGIHLISSFSGFLTWSLLVNCEGCHLPGEQYVVTDGTSGVLVVLPLQLVEPYSRYRLMFHGWGRRRWILIQVSVNTFVCCSWITNNLLCSNMMPAGWSGWVLVTLCCRGSFQAPEVVSVRLDVTFGVWKC